MNETKFNHKIVYVISLVENSLAFEWFFDTLRKHAGNFSVVFLHPSQPLLQKKLDEFGIATHWIHYRGKKDFALALLKLRKYFRKRKPDIVHTHLFDASMAGLLAAKLSGVPVKVHTRHHATQHHVYHPHAVKYDRFINSLSDRIVAISDNIKDILVSREKVHSNKVAVVHHGFRLSYFSAIDHSRTQHLIQKYNLENADYVVGLVSRFTVWKGIQYVIPAFSKLLEKKPGGVLLLANANGDYQQEINELLNQHLSPESYRLIQFEEDSPALYSLFSVFVHVPVDDHSEAFGQVYVEAFAAGLPCVYTLSGIAPAFVQSDKNALVVPFCDSAAIEKAIFDLLDQPSLAKRLKEQAAKDVAEFGIDKMVQRTLSQYEL